MMDDPGSENVDAVNTSDSVLADQTMDPEASVISTEEVSVISIEEAPVTSIEEASIISTEESTALADIKGTDGAASEDQNSANLVESSKYVSSDNQTGDIPSASEVVASKSATHYDNLYVKIQGRTINKLCSDDPEGMKAALRGLFRQWELESQPTCLVVPPVFCYNRNTEIFVLMQSKDDKTKALKSELCQSSNHKFTIKDVTLGRNIKKNIDDEEALDNLFPLRHMETYTDQTDYKLEMVKNAVAAVSFDELMKVSGSVSRKKCPTLFKKEFHLPPHITKVHAKLQDESVAVRVYLERCSESSEVVAGIRATQADGSYSFIPIEKCKHILKPIIELTQMFVKFMNDNKEVEPYDYNKKSGLICWLEMTSYPSFHSGSNGPKQNPEEEKVERQVLMTLALPYCTKTEELLPVDKLLNPASLKSMIEAAKMTECLRDPPEAAGSCEDYKNTLRLGSLAGSAPDIFDFDFVQANSQLAAVKGYLDRFRSSLVDLANALELKEYEGSLGIDITWWHHVSQCPVEWNRRSKLFYHHSGPVQSTLEGQAAGIVLDHRSRPGRPSMSNWYMLNKMLHKQLKFPQTHLIAFCQHASVINSLIKVCKFLTVADPDFQKSMLSLFEQKYSERIFLLDRDQGNLEKAITRAKSAPADIIVWRKGHEYMLKYPPHPFLEELVKRGLKTMVVVLDKVNVSPSAKDHNLQEELKFFTRRIFPRMVLTKVTTVDCVPGHHYVSVILKYKRNGALPELGLFPPSSTSNQPKKSLRGSLAKRAKLAVAGGGGNVAHSVDPPSNKRIKNRLSQRQRLAAARRPTSSQQRRPGAVHPPSSQQRRPGALQPPSSQQRRSGALQPPSSQQRRSGALQPPSSQQRRSGALQPPSSQQRRPGALQSPRSQQQRPGALQPPSTQQQPPGALQPPSSQQRHRSALQSPNSQQRRTGALQPPSSQQWRPGALKTPSSQQRRPGVLQTPSSQQQWRPGALQSSNSQQRRPGALQPTSSQSTDVFQTINEIVNTQTRLQELMSLLASSGVLPSAQPSLEHGLTAFGVPQQRGMSSLDDDLIQEARPRRPDRRLGYNPRADWREETWLLPGSSEGGRGRKRRSEMPNDEPRRPKQMATGIDAYGPPPPAWDPREQTSSGRSQYRMERAMQHDGQFGNYEDDDDSSYESLKIETVSVKSESSDRSNSYEMTPRRNWDIPHSQFVEKYEDMSGYGSASNYQQGWYRNQSGTSVEQEDLRRRRYPEDSHGFRESHPTSLESESRGVHYGRSTSSHPTNANVTQHGAGVSSSNVHQYGNMSMFGHSSYNPYSYAGDDGWKN